MTRSDIRWCDANIIFCTQTYIFPYSCNDFRFYSVVSSPVYGYYYWYLFVTKLCVCTEFVTCLSMFYTFLFVLDIYSLVRRNTLLLHLLTLQRRTPPTATRYLQAPPSSGTPGHMTDPPLAAVNPLTPTRPVKKTVRTVFVNWTTLLSISGRRYIFSAFWKERKRKQKKPVGSVVELKQ